MIPLEHDEQATFCKYLDANKILYYAVPNGTLLKGRNKYGIINKLKNEGMKNGVPDLCVLLPNKTIYIEMKRQKGGVVSDDQKRWIAKINEMPYAEAYVCRGAAEAIETICNNQ